MNRKGWSVGGRELSTSYVDAFNRRDPEQMWAMLHAEVVYQVGGGEPFSGQLAVQAYYEWSMAGDVVATTVRSVEEGDTVVLENQITGSLPDGRRYVIEQAVRHRWVDGLLCDYRNYNDPPIVDGHRITLDEFFALMAGA